jgi:two-component system chemotaxis response regulator CheY
VAEAKRNVSKQDDKAAVSSWISSLRSRRDRDAETPSGGLEAAADSAETARADGLVTEPAQHAGKLEVLLIENNVFVGQFVRHAVQKLGRELAYSDGHELVVARPSDDPLNLLAMRQPAVIVLDHHQSDLMDCSLVRSIRALPGHARTPILMVSTGGDDVRGEALAAGVSMYVEKPIQLTRLTATLREMIAPEGESQAADAPLRRSH